jgi:hypothetical protein
VVDRGTGGLVNLAVAWPLSGPSRRSLAKAGDNAYAAGLPPVSDLADDPGFRSVLVAGLVMFPLMAAAGVGLGSLVGARLRWFGVVVGTTVLVAMPLGGLTALGDTEPPGCWWRAWVWCRCRHWCPQWCVPLSARTVGPSPRRCWSVA